MRDLVEHIIKWFSDISEPIPLLSPGPSLQMLYGGQPLTASYGIEGEPAYQALEEHLRGGELWQTFQRYQEHRWDYWSIQSDHQYLGNAGWIESEQAKLAVKQKDRDRIWTELQETMYQVSMGLRGLLLVEQIPGECRWC